MSGHRNKTKDSFIGGIILLGFALWLFASHPVWATILIVIICAGLFAPKPMRYACKKPLAKSAHQWLLDGKQRKVCSHCNDNLRRKASREATRNF